MLYELRPYQKEAVEAAVTYLKGASKDNAIEVLPTGAGKSLVIANIAARLNEPVLIFQPSKEILEQNYEKMLSYGYPASIYSASVGRKEVSDITYATIGSARNKTDLFKEFKNIIVDECHYVSAKGGMYCEFLKGYENGVKILGLTATPYRLASNSFGSELRFLTRTRPKIFRDLIYYVQNEDLFNAGYLARLQDVSPPGFDRGRIRLNTTGADFEDNSVKAYYREIGFQEILANQITFLASTRKNVLVFTRFVEESQHLVSKVPGSAIVTAETPKGERERIIGGFRNGKIKVICNVGILCHGFDYPELETIVMARPTMSLALYYQMIGRGIRPHPGKDHALVVDLCGNLGMFGPIEKLKIRDGGNGKWFISNNGRQLTNIYFGEPWQRGAR